MAVARPQRAVDPTPPGEAKGESDGGR